MSSHDPEIEIDPYSRESIRKALRAWDSVKNLGEHILADLLIVQQRRQSAGYSNTPAGRGLALRETLVAAIEALRPGDGPPDPQDKRWRPFIIINEQYVSERSPGYILDNLHISRRTYYNDQEQGMEMLSDMLSQWEAQAKGAAKTSPDRVPDPQGGELYQVPFLAPPRPTHDLVGRDDLLLELKTRLLASAENPVLALQGLPGVGKTTLAIALAHDPEILSHFSDGVLWAGLGRQPDASALLGAWAAALQIPAEILERCTSHTESARAIHAAIGLRRILLIIDDAWSIEEALAFRLGGPNCACLLTTRRANIALDFAGDGVIITRELQLDQGMDLLMEFAPQVVDTEPDEARTLVEAVGGLPLALILMGRHLRQHSQGVPTRRLRAALQQLQESEARLQLTQPQSLIEQRPDLPPGASLSLETIIGLSDTALTATARQGLRDLALFPPKPNTFSEEAALAVLAAGPEILDILLDHGLLEYASADRYMLHQTITDYAQVGGISTEAQQRFVTYFSAYVERPDASIERELNNLLTALDFAYQAESWAELCHSVLALQPFLARRGLYQTAQVHLKRALEATQQAGDQKAQVELLYHLGVVVLRLSRFSEAEAFLQKALALAQEHAWPDFEAKSLGALGDVAFHQNDYQGSKEFHELALALHDQMDATSGKTAALVGLGHTMLHLGEYAQAPEFYKQALQLCEESGDQEGQTRALNGLGLSVWNQADFDAAQDYFRQCYRLSHKIGSWRMEAVALHNLGLVFDDLCDYAEARNCLQRALDIFRSVGDRRTEGRNLGNLGLFSHHLGDHEAAEEYCLQAIHIAEEVGDMVGQAYAYTYLGHALNDLGEAQPALAAYQKSLDFWRELGNDDQSMEALAGLARVYTSLGEIKAALELIDEVLAFEKECELISTLDEPFRVYLTCYQVLSTADQTARAVEILRAAYARLQDQASQIDDAQQRQAYLENVPSHRQLIEAYQTLKV